MERGTKNKKRMEVCYATTNIITPISQVTQLCTWHHAAPEFNTRKDGENYDFPQNTSLKLINQSRMGLTAKQPLLIFENCYSHLFCCGIRLQTLEQCALLSRTVPHSPVFQPPSTRLSPEGGHCSCRAHEETKKMCVLLVWTTQNSTRRHITHDIFALYEQNAANTTVYTCATPQGGRTKQHPQNSTTPLTSAINTGYQ